MVPAAIGQLLEGKMDMESRNIFRKLTAVAAVSAALLLGSTSASAHCDGEDGPVINAARQALEAGNPNPVLIWVQKDDEAQIMGAFQHALEVRKLGPAARELADHYFFETLVRVHRAGEGAPYTGIKPDATSARRWSRATRRWRRARSSLWSTCSRRPSSKACTASSRT